MANSFSVDFPEIWAREQQEIFYKENVGVKVADMSFNSTMSKGDTLNRPYRQNITEVEAYTRGSSITITDLTDTQESLSINKEYAFGFYMDAHDVAQSNYDLVSSYARDFAVNLSNQVDADILSEVSNATSTVDDGSIGGTAGNPIALTSANILKVVSAAKKSLRKQNIPLNNLFGVISPEFEEILIQYGAGRDTVYGDGFNKNGFIASFYGFDLYSSNQLQSEVVLSLATNPTANDTVVIDGNTYTFVASPSAEGDIDIGVDVDTTRANLESAINAPGTTTATYIAFSDTDVVNKIANKWSAVNDDTANTLTITANGIGVLEVSETLTDGTDAFSKEIQHNMFGKKGAVTVVMQKDAKPVMRDVETKMGKNILNSVLYGVKTFADGAKKMVDVQIDSSSY